MSGTSNRAVVLGLMPTTLNALTAFAGGGQGGATLLSEEFNRITTVATIGDSTLLPPATVGRFILVINVGVAAMDIFPGIGDAINALAVNTALRLNPQGTMNFICAVAGIWNTTVVSLAPTKFTSINVTVGTLAAGVITGAEVVTVLSTNAAPGNQTTRTATQMFADTGNVQPGDSYFLQICNSGAGTLTLLAGSGVTLGSGTYTVPTNTSRTFVVTYTTAIALNMQTIGVGTWS
jgi:hypothetical protein